MAGAIRLYHSFLRKGSTALRRPPFFDFVRRLFFPIAILTSSFCYCVSVGEGGKSEGYLLRLNFQTLIWVPKYQKKILTKGIFYAKIQQ